MRELPHTWRSVLLGEVCKLKNGFAFKSGDYIEKGIPVLRISDINSGFVKPDKSVKVEPQHHYEDHVVSENDILIAMSGATTGKFGIFKSEQKAYQNQRVGKFQILHNSELDKRFLFYHLHALKRQIEKDAYGGAQPNISSSKIEAMEILLPPKETQQAIVSKIEELFSELDKGIENLRLAQQQLKTYRQSVLKWAFEGKFTNAREDVTRNGVKPHSMVAEEQEGSGRKLPKGWKMVLLKDLCNIIGGVTKGRDFKGKRTIHLPYLRVANVQDGYLDLKEIKSIEVLPGDNEKYRLVEGDILYTEGGDKDKLGRGTIWKNEIQDCIHQNHIFRARPITNVNSKYIAYYSQTKKAKNYFFSHGKQTTNLASINLTILSNLQLALASRNEQDKIVDEIEERFSAADKMEESINQSLQQAESLRQSILKKAFEGNLI